MYMYMYLLLHVYNKFTCRPRNKIKRMRWACAQLLAPDDYNNVIWLDESKVEAWRRCRRINQKRGTPNVRSQAPKKPQSVSMFQHWCVI